MNLQKPYTFSIILMIATLCLMLFSMSVNANIQPTDVKQPFSAQNCSTDICEIPKQAITTVSSIPELNKQISISVTAGKPILVFFTSDQCNACKEISATIFNNYTIKNLLNSFILLKVDLTDPDSESHMIAKKYAVIGTPTMIFFNKDGHVNNIKIIGNTTPQEFSKTVQSIPLQ